METRLAESKICEDGIRESKRLENPLKLKRIHHVEFWVGNARQAAYFYRNFRDLTSLHSPPKGCWVLST
jgi:hypothetical protein